MASSTKAADSNIEIKRYAALGGALGTSAVLATVSPGRAGHGLRGPLSFGRPVASENPKNFEAKTSSKTSENPKIRLKIRFWKNFEVANGHHKVKPRHAGDVTWNVSTNVGSCDATDCGLRCLILSQCLQTRPINYSQEVRQPQSLRPPLTWQIICIVRRYQEGLNSTRFKGRSNKTGKSSSVTNHRTISKIPNESPKVASLNVRWNLSRLLLSLSAWHMMIQKHLVLFALCILPDATAKSQELTAQGHKTCALSACVGVGWGFKFGACICMYEWSVLICIDLRCLMMVMLVALPQERAFGCCVPKPQKTSTRPETWKHEIGHVLATHAWRKTLTTFDIWGVELSPGWAPSINLTKLESSKWQIWISFYVKKKYLSQKGLVLSSFYLGA